GRGQGFASASVTSMVIDLSTVTTRPSTLTTWLGKGAKKSNVYLPGGTASEYVPVSSVYVAVRKPWASEMLTEAPSSGTPVWLRITPLTTTPRCSFTSTVTFCDRTVTVFASSHVRPPPTNW